MRWILATVPFLVLVTLSTFTSPSPSSGSTSPSTAPSWSGSGFHVDAAHSEWTTGRQEPLADLSGLALWPQMPALAAKPVPEAPLPTPAPVRAASVASVSHGAEFWRPLVMSVFGSGKPLEDALIILDCESHGNPDVTGLLGERGLFQIHPLHADSTYDPLGNVLAAYRISSGGTSWGAWANCSRRLP